MRLAIFKFQLAHGQTVCDCYHDDMDEVEGVEPAMQVAPLQVVKTKRK